LKLALPIGMLISVSAIAIAVALTNSDTFHHQKGSSRRLQSGQRLTGNRTSPSIAPQLQAGIHALSLCCHLDSLSSRVTRSQVKLTATASQSSLDFLRLLSLFRGLRSSARIALDVRDTSRSGRLLLVAATTPQLHAWVAPGLLAASPR
jgi:hypothetical protein